jgi:hypothetical protein
MNEKTATIKIRKPGFPLTLLSAEANNKNASMIPTLKMKRTNDVHARYLLLLIVILCKVSQPDKNSFFKTLKARKMFPV